MVGIITNKINAQFESCRGWASTTTSGASSGGHLGRERWQCGNDASNAVAEKALSWEQDCRIYEHHAGDAVGYLLQQHLHPHPCQRVAHQNHILQIIHQYYLCPVTHLVRRHPPAIC